MARVQFGNVGGGSGDVVGPAGATDRAIAIYNLATGKIIQNSLVIINASGDVNIPTGRNYYIGGVQISVGNVFGAAPLASPIFTGTPQITTTPPVGDNSHKIADTAFVIANASGNVTGPAASADGEIVTFSGATGRIIKRSGSNSYFLSVNLTEILAYGTGSSVINIGIHPKGGGIVALISDVPGSTRLTGLARASPNTGQDITDAASKDYVDLYAISHNTIFDAVGDMVVGTGDNAAAKLSLPAAGSRNGRILTIINDGTVAWGDISQGGQAYISTPAGQNVAHGFSGVVPTVVAVGTVNGDIVVVDSIDSTYFHVKITNCASCGTGSAQYIRWIAFVF